MRVLFTSFPGNTHFFNSVPLAWALCAAGHEVRVASGPELVDTITRAGLTAVPVGSAETLKDKTDLADTRTIEQWTSAFRLAGTREGTLTWRDLIDWNDLTRVYRTVLAPAVRTMNDSMIDDLVAFSRSWKPDLVLWDAVTYAGSIAAMAAGAAHARILYAHDVDAQLRAHYVRMKGLQPPHAREDAIQEWMEEWAGKYGFGFSEELLNGHFTIDQLPPSFRVATGLDYLSMRYVPYNSTATVPKWLWSAPSAPRVLMTFGLSSRAWSHLQVMSIDQVQETLNALADLDIELVVTLPDDHREQLTHVPENTRVVEFVPLHAILPSCSAVLHQGGPGGFNASLKYGVPQLLVTMTPDAALKTQHLHRSEAGISIAPVHVTAEKVRDALVRLLEDPSFRSGADRIRQEIEAQPSPHDLVPHLERLTAEHRHRVPEAIPAR